MFFGVFKIGGDYTHIFVRKQTLVGEHRLKIQERKQKETEKPT